ncbi:MAG TPA: hypothetical protein VGM72_12400 [Micropepsaceae bacterium]|jgi:hypothetical protein
MTAFTTLHPLKYIAEALSQMATTLRDFEMLESAQLLDKAKSDIDQKLIDRLKRGTAQKR